MLYTVLIISIIVVIIVLLLSILTINKGYAYKHTVDHLEENSYTTETDQTGTTEKEKE
jgi:uncharacterized membrane protein